MKAYSVKTLARMLDITERRVRQLRTQGILHEAAPGYYELYPNVVAYIRYIRDGSDTGADAKIDYHSERAMLVHAKRLNEEYDLDIKRGTLHQTEDIKLVWTRMFTSFKQKLSSLPSKAAPVLQPMSGTQEIYAYLDKEIKEALTELADFDALGLECDKDGCNDVPEN